jgi:hypothetical protein
LGEPIQYAIEPGVTTGDVGNPGNIREVGSIDFKLYAPICQGFGFVKVPVNANGEAKIERLITNFHIPNTRHPSCIKREKPFHGQSINFGGEYTNPLPEDPTQPRASVYPPEMQQPLMSYREAAEDPTFEDGNLYERDPNVHNAIGPYTMQPGDSIKFYRILCFGDMDRNISMRGGLEATKQLDMDFVSPNEGTENEHAAIKNFRKNWDAAMYLIENNFTPEAVPPPTPGLPPRTGHPEEELKAEASVLEVDGKRQAAIELRWNDVHTGYKDALTGADDFAGYYVYRSDVAVEGPWEKIATITKEQANQKLDGDQVVHKVEARAGVPFRYSVTSFDTDGNESGRTCYTLDAISSKRAPEDDQSLVRVVPNPFKQIAGFFDDREQKRLAFVNIPAVCTIRIYNLAGDLIQTVKHDDGFGEEAWGSSVNDENNYMLTRFRQNVMPGLYIYHIESHVSGHEGETSVGKFAVIK